LLSQHKQNEMKITQEKETKNDMRKVFDTEQSIYETYETSRKYSLRSEETWDIKELKKSLVEISEMNNSPCENSKIAKNANFRIHDA